MWPAQQPQAVRQDNWFGYEASGTGNPAVGLKIVAGKVRLAPIKCGPEHAMEGGPINAGWIVEIKFVATSRRKVRSVAIKIVQRQTRGISVQGGLEFFCQPALAGPAAADDRDEEGRAGK